MTFIPLSVPNMGKKEAEYVNGAVVTGWVSSVGTYVSRFEDELSAYTGLPGAVACQSGTAALHLAMISMGISGGDMVIVPSFTFIAAVNPVRYLGAAPIFMDCDDSLCMDPAKLRSFCEECCFVKNKTLYHRDTGKRIPLVVVVHVFGNMADMEAIMEVAGEFHLMVLEDASEAIGTIYKDGIYRNKMAGTIGDIGVYSFNGNKIITTGGGGMAVSGDPDRLKHIRYLSTQAKDDEVYFIHNEIGYNYRMTNVQAAIGVAQLERLESFIGVKTANFHLYELLLDDISGLSFVQMRAGTRPNYWMYGLLLPCAEHRDQLLKKLEGEKIQTRPAWGLIHDQKPYVNDLAYKIEKARYYVERILNIPCSSGLTPDEVHRVSGCIRALYA